MRISCRWRACLALPASLILLTPALAEDDRTKAAIALQTALERVCVPLIEGKDAKSVAAAGGMRQDGRRLVLAIAGDRSITVSPPSPANPNVCSMTLRYAPGADDALVGLLQDWARSRGLEARKVGEKSRGPFFARTTYTWDGTSPRGAMAIVFAQEKTLDGKPAAGALDQATVLLSLTKG